MKKWKFNIMLALGGIAFIAVLGERSEGAPVWAYLAVKAAAVAVLWWASRVISRMQRRGEVTLDDEEV